MDDDMIQGTNYFVHVCKAGFVPGVHGRRKERLASAVCACEKFSQKSGKPCYFGILLRMDYA